MNARQQRDRDRPEAQRMRAPPTVGARLDDRVDRQHQRTDEQHRTRCVRAPLEADSAVIRQQSGGEHAGRDPDRDVDEEDPVPVDRLRQDAAGQQADRAAGRGHEAVDPDRLGLLGRPREHRHDHAQDHSGGHRPADALDEPRADQQRPAVGQAAHQRGRREHRQPGEEDAPAPDQVAQPADQQQQPAERDQVRVDDPGQRRLREVQVGLDRRQRDVHDRLVEDDHQESRRTARPARSSGCCRRWRWPTGDGTFRSSVASAPLLLEFGPFEIEP